MLPSIPPPARGGDVPFFDLVDLRVLELGTNTAQCAITCGPWLEGLGALGIPAEMVALADCALAYAATRVSGEGMGMVSVSLRVDYRSVAPPSIGSVLTSATTAWPLDHGAIYSEGPITDERGDVLASTSLRGLAIPAGRMQYTASAGERRPAAPEPAPIEPARPPAPAYEAQFAPLLATALARSCSLEVASAADAEVEMTAVAPPELERNGGVVHGGGVGLLAHLALAGVTAAVFPGPEPPRPLDLHVDYLRPLAIGSPLILRGRVQHRTRRLALITADIVGADGRPAVLARETCALP